MGEFAKIVIADKMATAELIEGRLAIIYAERSMSANVKYFLHFHIHSQEKAIYRVTENYLSDHGL